MFEPSSTAHDLGRKSTYESRSTVRNSNTPISVVDLLSYQVKFPPNSWAVRYHLAGTVI